MMAGSFYTIVVFCGNRVVSTTAAQFALVTEIMHCTRQCCFSPLLSMISLSQQMQTPPDCMPPLSFSAEPGHVQGMPAGPSHSIPHLVRDTFPLIQDSLPVHPTTPFGPSVAALHLSPSLVLVCSDQPRRKDPIWINHHSLTGQFVKRDTIAWFYWFAL